MDRKLGRLGLFALLCCSGAYAEEEDYGSQEMAETFVECAGLWEASSQLMARSDRPATAEHLHNMANGARTAAAWSLWTQWHLDNPSKPSRKLGEWTDGIAMQVDAQTTRYAAIQESGDTEFFGRQVAFCTDVSEAQANILRDLRKSYAAPEQ